MKKLLLLQILIWSSFVLMAQNTDWPAINPEMKPGTRWWWLGSAVDEKNLSINLEKYARAGIGSVEITPIYGVKNNDANNIPFLSEKWMKMLKHTLDVTQKNGMFTDMNTGTGWPFGGREITPEYAASKLLTMQWTVEGKQVFSALIKPDDTKQTDAVLLRLMAYQDGKVINLTSKVDAAGNINCKLPKGKWLIVAAFNGKTYQKVKRAAPGGEGYVLDHFSAKAVQVYLDKFEKAFESTQTTYPHHFFNDSYEVYGADWTADFFDQFARRRGYKLEHFLPDFLSTERNDKTDRLIADYRETISDLLLENFTKQWTDWAHSHGSKTRNQAHGSPGNLIDLYATVDVPECEGFGLSDFKIPGLRTDSLTRKNDSDLSMLKYASSAAHIAGKPFVSSETFTWLTEHFRTSLSQCKPDLDLMFASGVNHMNFHGTPYSPEDATWPGWLFYASINMSPSNTIWRDAPAMFQYITRCQSFLQEGKPDNDFLMYLPVYDAWYQKEGRFFQFSIHDMEKLMPDFIHAVMAVYQHGYDVDYISDKFIMELRMVNGKLTTKAGISYQTLILPAVKMMPLKVLQKVLQLADQGATIVFLNQLPADIPGFYQHEKGRKAIAGLKKKYQLQEINAETILLKTGKGRIITGTSYHEVLNATGVKPEIMKTEFGLHAIRRSNDTGFHYFISGLQDKAVDARVKLAVHAQSAILFDPVSGLRGRAELHHNQGDTEVLIQLKPGASVILKTFTDTDVTLPPWPYMHQKVSTVDIISPWELSFVNTEPVCTKTFKTGMPQYWTVFDDPEMQVLTGTGKYSTQFEVNKETGLHYLLKLKDVRESARVFLNGKELAVLWAVPFECLLDEHLINGKNKLEIEVTSLPANRIAEYDRKGTPWRNFNEINMVNIKYKPSDYSNWQPVDCGLSGRVQIECFK